MREIPFINKQTNSNTQYTEILPTDLQWILVNARLLVDIANTNVLEAKTLFTPNVLLPKRSTGKRNTPQTLCEGILDNFSKSQYNLTTKQMEGLAISFNIANKIIDEFESVQFVEVFDLPKIKRPQSVTVVNELPSELFEIESISITYKPR